ncbi:MFS transporter [Endozoicomonas sp. SM1973]|uniref:3-methyl-2-oxobutanoate dehydrogenase (2-methylpropanoyl-transferring) n=1 Tax=Spartinivicinus marinus TaxID=2994442 RepID=A0A853I7K9_9GAMM|nr:alpha-ketoacid dehydrogenase subunit alpha/beta [Spartinivicinus marinus]MCX4028870.1 thiamine pyrophosphate-dependent enzyme [Spartinivicinus marinus]NYZ65547.1 MFS transporter [Spartinivicinus marinus]
MRNRAEVIDENFIQRVQQGHWPYWSERAPLANTHLTPQQLVELFESQLLSRHLDLEARRMQKRGEAFYTIGSTGHEGMAAVAAAFEYTDMAFLHYRDAAFFIQRSKQLPGQTPLYDMLLSFAASSDDPIAGGRHKVLGSKRLFIPPQTSTIASHLPKAVGTAYSVPLAKRIGCGELPQDSLVVCSFGDASLNHSTAQGALNTAAWTSYQQVPLPIVFVCEDNGIGISTPTPKGWVAQTIQAREDIIYLSCNGLDLIDTYQTAQQAVLIARKQRKPVFLHFRCVRLLGHAGSDAETAYLNRAQIIAQESMDPLLFSACLLVEEGILSAGQVIDLYQWTADRVGAVAKEVATKSYLSDPNTVVASLIPPQRESVTTDDVNEKDRSQAFARDKLQLEKPQHLAKLLNWALVDLMLKYQNIVLAGEDIGPKGGVYNVTSKLVEKFGAHRIINTLLDEQSILGLAIGLAHNGFIPIPEIQFLAYIHNAEDQIRGEASTLSFFSQGQYTNPMVIRIPGLGYQKGFGGHFHNDNSFAVFRDIPGVIIACPSNGADAVGLLRECVRLAAEEQRIVVFIEPIALYMTRDLHEPGDEQWLSTYPEPGKQPIGCGEIGQYGNGTDLCIITYGNGYYLSRQAAKQLTEQCGISLRVVDLRWLAPLNHKAILEAAAPCQSVLIVDECRQTGSISEALMTLFMEQMTKMGDFYKPIKRLTATDSFIPIGRAASCTLPSKVSIIQAALDVVNQSGGKNSLYDIKQA